MLQKLSQAATQRIDRFDDPGFGNGTVILLREVDLVCEQRKETDHLLP